MKCHSFYSQLCMFQPMNIFRLKIWLNVVHIFTQSSGMSAVAVAFLCGEECLCQESIPQFDFGVFWQPFLSQPTVQSQRRRGEVGHLFLSGAHLPRRPAGGCHAKHRPPHGPHGPHTFSCSVHCGGWRAFPPILATNTATDDIPMKSSTATQQADTLANFPISVKTFGDGALKREPSSSWIGLHH